MANPDDFDLATARAAERRVTNSYAVAARYDRRLGYVMVSLNGGLGIFFAPVDTQGLEGATADELEEIEISPSGLGLHFPRRDADLYLPALLEGMLGSERWMAARFGRLGGQARSDAKIAASRENGRRGGRPKKRALDTLLDTLLDADTAQPHPRRSST